MGQGEGTQLESNEGKSAGQRKSTRELCLGLDPAGLSAAPAAVERAPPPRGERKDLRRKGTSINPHTVGSAQKGNGIQLYTQ